MSVFDVLNAVEPKRGVTVRRDIPYGEGERGALDVYAPEKAGGPTVVFFYGGSWDSGHRADYGWVGHALARQGFTAVIPDYRIHPHACWPDFLEDAAKAVRWTHDNVPGPLFLMGHSAGAYNAAMLAIDKCWLAAEGLDPSRLSGWIGLSGPYDFLPLRSDKLKAIFGPADQWPRTQPVTHVVGGEPPALLITGDRDKTVLPRNSDRLGAKLGDATVIHYPKLDHTRTVAALATPLRFLAPIMRGAVAFMSGSRARPSPAA